MKDTRCLNHSIILSSLSLERNQRKVMVMLIGKRLKVVMSGFKLEWVFFVDLNSVQSGGANTVVELRQVMAFVFCYSKVV